MIKKTACIFLGALVLAPIGVLHASEPFPNKPIRLVVGFVPGGGTDVSARIIAQHLSGVIGQQIVVENKPGASGLIAGDMVARAEPDGYTLLLANMQSTVSAPYLLPVSYDPVKGFTAVRYVGSVPNILVVNPTKNDVKSVKELIGLIKASPSKYTYASSGMGSPQHLSAARFSQITGATMEHIPYKGSGQAMTDLLGGQVDMNFDTLPGAIGQVKAGKLRPLAVTSAKRAASLPDVPTLAESGIKGMDVEQWYAILAPAKVPAAILAKLDQALKTSLKDPGVATKLADQGMIMGGGPENPAEFQTFIQDEYAKYGRITKDLGLKKP